MVAIRVAVSSIIGAGKLDRCIDVSYEMLGTRPLQSGHKPLASPERLEYAISAQQLRSPFVRW
jgi:hypothetical protein